LSLIHVKGAHTSAATSAANRGISVSDYERVTAQAVKNINFLDNQLLVTGLEAIMRERIEKLVWRDGERQERRDEMLAALGGIGSSYQRRVVVVQPRVSRGAYNAARKDQDAGTESGRVARLRQLDTLLLAAEASCRELGSEFVVVGDGS